jgi:hypothetical protein
MVTAPGLRLAAAGCSAIGSAGERRGQPRAFSLYEASLVDLGAVSRPLEIAKGPSCSSAHSGQRQQLASFSTSAHVRNIGPRSSCRGGSTAKA